MFLFITPHTSAEPLINYYSITCSKFICRVEWSGIQSARKLLPVRYEDSKLKPCNAGCARRWRRGEQWTPFAQQPNDTSLYGYSAAAVVGQRLVVSGGKDATSGISKVGPAAVRAQTGTRQQAGAAPCQVRRLNS